MPRGGKAAIAAKKAKENKSFGEKLKSGIRSLGSDIAMGVGAKNKTDDYIRRTANTVAVNKALASGDRESLSADLHGRYDRRKSLEDVGRDSSSSGSNILAEEEIETPAETFAANKKRYDDYMAEQEANARKAAQMDRATMLYEQQNMGAGPVPPQMQGLGAFQNPYMQQATSPAFNLAAQNYGQLGGMQRMYDRPKEMMSQRERQGVNRLYDAMREPVPMPYPYPRMPNVDFGKSASMSQPQPQQVQSAFGRMLEARFGSGPSNMMNKGNQGGGFGF